MTSLLFPVSAINTSLSVPRNEIAVDDISKTFVSNKLFIYRPIACVSDVGSANFYLFEKWSLYFAIPNILLSIDIINVLNFRMFFVLILP